MKYFYFLLVGIILLAGIYTMLGIAYFKWADYQVHNPKAEFLVIENEGNNLTIVEFTNYSCGFCKKLYPAIKDILNLHKDVRYIPRLILLPVPPDAEKTQKPEQLEKLAIAAGMQGKFKEMHEVFMEYPEGIIPEDIIKESAELYGIDYKKMVKDAKGKTVQKYLTDNMNDMLSTNIKSIPSYVVGKKIYIVQETMPTFQELLKLITNEKEDR